MTATGVRQSSPKDLVGPFPKDKQDRLRAMLVQIEKNIGGIPKGRIVEIYGPESSGKTTPTLHL